MKQLKDFIISVILGLAAKEIQNMRDRLLSCGKFGALSHVKVVQDRSLFPHIERRFYGEKGGLLLYIDNSPENLYTHYHLYGRWDKPPILFKSILKPGKIAWEELLGDDDGE